MDYELEHVAVDRPAPGVVRLTLDRPERLNATNDALHHALTRLPVAVDSDPDARVAIVTGAGRAFCVGGDYADIAGRADDYDYKLRGMRETLQIATALIDMRKPLIAAINGPAAGIGLALALLSDISIANAAANLCDGHTRIGLAAGDHAALVWPLLCSMAHAKRYLLTCDKITGAQAAAIGLVSEAVPSDELHARALEIANTLVERAPLALELTKRSLNAWYRQALPIFEASLGYEMVTSFAPTQRSYVPAE